MSESSRDGLLIKIETYWNVNKNEQYIITTSDLLK